MAPLALIFGCYGPDPLAHYIYLYLRIYLLKRRVKCILKNKGSYGNYRQDELSSFSHFKKNLIKKYFPFCSFPPKESVG